MPEYLVNFKTLVDIAEEYDLVLEKKVNFHEYYDQMVTSCEWDKTKKYRQDLLQRMVMNKVTSLDQEQIEQQWEVSGLYCLIVFRKRENKDPEYKPKGVGRHPKERSKNNGTFGNLLPKRPIIDD